MHNLRYGCVVILILALLVQGVTGSPAAAAAASVTSAATPSNATPEAGEEITVTINIDMSGASAPDHKLGSFTGTLGWNPAVLRYKSNSGIQAGFTGVVNTTQVTSGQLTFNGANALGASGNIVVLTVTFDVLRTGTSVLNLEYPAMAAASTFANLRPVLTVTDGLVVVGSGGQYSIFLPAVRKNR